MHTKKAAIAAHLYIGLRREARRSIDVEWLLTNPEYAREILALARRHTHQLASLANYYEALLAESEPSTTQHAVASFATPHPPLTDLENRYVGRLR